MGGVRGNVDLVSLVSEVFGEGDSCDDWLLSLCCSDPGVGSRPASVCVCLAGVI